MNRIRIILAGIIICVSLNSCSDLLKSDKEKEEENIISKAYNPDNIKSQQFSIDPAKDTLLKGGKGTMLKIYAGTFVDSDGKPITTPVDITIKEALSMQDIVLANLTTTSDNQILESGGMIYLDATTGGKQVKLADEKEIGVVIPAAKTLEGMSLFEGKMENGKINWVQAAPVLNDEIRSLEQQSTTVTYYVLNEKRALTAADDTIIRDAIFKDEVKKGDILNLPDYDIKIGKIEKTKVTVQLEKGKNGLFIQDVVNQKGQNTFVEDYNTNYIFSVKKLGWANIDRLYEDPRIEVVDLVTKVDNYSDFKNVYITMVFGNQKIYLPGYQREDNTFAFTHDDEEPTLLPVGEEVTIMATAYKDDVPYFNLKKIKIAKSQVVSFPLEKSTPEEMKEALGTKL